MEYKRSYAGEVIGIIVIIIGAIIAIATIQSPQELVIAIMIA